MTRTTAEELLAEFLRKLDSGETMDFEALLREHPAHADELRRLFDAECARLEAEACVVPFRPFPASGAPGASGAGARAEDAARAVARLEARSATFARYTLQEPIGKGGMGIVRRVHDEDLDRDLAMKIGLDAPAGAVRPTDATRLARFLQEARVTAQLDHPGVVPVHELGVDPEGRVYFTMKLVKGRTFAQILDFVAKGAEGWTRVRALGVIQRVCEAMAYAHEKGVLHRDLKPTNVMVGEFGEVYVMDWGLARLAAGVAPPAPDDPRPAAPESPTDPTDSSSLTRDGQIVGTPAYMSPEQAVGLGGAVGPHSDVYAVGAMLHHLLAGRPPSAREPAAIPRTVPAELAAICEKALSLEWQKRYRDMASMSADLTAFLEGRVVTAYETGALAEARKWVRRNRGLAAALAAMLLVLASGVVVSLSLKTKADANALEATKIASFLEQTIAGVRPSVALGRDTTMLREMMDAAWERVEAGELSSAPHAEIRVAWLIGDALREMAEYERAEPVLRAAIAMGRALGDGDDPYLAWSLSTLSLVLIERGRTAEAVPLAREALAMTRHRRGESDPNAVTRMGNLAVVLTRNGDLEEAEALLREALALSEVAHVADDEAKAEYAQNLAVILIGRGELEEAEELSRISLAMLERCFPGPHPSVAMALANLAALLGRRGDVASADALHQRALDMRRALFRGDHPDLAQSLGALGKLRHVRRDLESAEAFYREAVEMRRRFDPEDHAELALCLNNLGVVLRDRGDSAAAETLLREALEMRKRLYPGDHLDVAIGLNNLGMLLAQRGDAESAVTTLIESLAMLQRLLPENDPTLAAVNVNVGQLRQSAGDLTAAEHHFRAALTIARAVLPASHASSLRAALGLGAVLLARGEFEAAAALLEETEPSTRESAGASPEDRTRCLKLLVEAFTAWEGHTPGVGHGDKAQAWARQLAPASDG